MNNPGEICEWSNIKGKEKEKETKKIFSDQGGPINLNSASQEKIKPKNENTIGKKKKRKTKPNNKESPKKRVKEQKQELKKHLQIRESDTLLNSHMVGSSTDSNVVCNQNQCLLSTFPFDLFFLFNGVYFFNQFLQSMEERIIKTQTSWTYTVVYDISQLYSTHVLYTNVTKLIPFIQTKPPMEDIAYLHFNWDQLNELLSKIIHDLNIANLNSCYFLINKYCFMKPVNPSDLARIHDIYLKDTKPLYPKTIFELFSYISKNLSNQNFNSKFVRVFLCWIDRILNLKTFFSAEYLESVRMFELVAYKFEELQQHRFNSFFFKYNNQEFFEYHPVWLYKQKGIISQFYSHSHTGNKNNKNQLMVGMIDTLIRTIKEKKVIQSDTIENGVKLLESSITINPKEFRRFLQDIIIYSGHSCLLRLIIILLIFNNEIIRLIFIYFAYTHSNAETAAKLMNTSTMVGTTPFRDYFNNLRNVINIKKLKFTITLTEELDKTPVSAINFFIDELTNQIYLKYPYLVVIDKNFKDSCKGFRENKTSIEEILICTNLVDIISEESKLLFFQTMNPTEYRNITIANQIERAELINSLH